MYVHILDYESHMINAVAPVAIMHADWLRKSYGSERTVSIGLTRMHGDFKGFWTS